MIKKNMKNKRNEKKAEIDTDILIYIGIAIGVLLVFGIGYLIVTGKLSGYVSYIKNLFRFWS